MRTATRTLVLVCFVVAVLAAVQARPTIYKRNEDNVFEPGGRTNKRTMIRGFRS